MTLQHLNYEQDYKSIRCQCCTQQFKAILDVGLKQITFYSKGGYMIELINSVSNLNHQLKVNDEIS